MKGGQDAVVPLSENGSIPHEQSDVPIVPLSKPDSGDGDDDLRDEEVVLRLVPEDAATEAALLSELEELVAEGIGRIVERPA
jgi:hypothetical protein